ncbi:hypothetical protein SAMN04487928_1154 [Butyrivibrio proteoclasticus]|uniref:DUF8201 domain-containing protein n=1 Tax=Butyrivibrio proteoclasticus TaxID=43305 RepID=A0A1I5UZ29_9FIRM|nr:hypothetical protein [Butyrivibrio proteoclasticus]SFQ00480.1 hypothetical protein SAMN04487928_1154 [Butyrivibrio proteoclasticus]
MIAVILTWIYVLATAYLTGFFFLNVITSLDCMAFRNSKGVSKKYKIRYQESYIVAGLVVVTVFSQLWSLFSGVGLMANALLVLFDVAVAFYYRERLLEEFYLVSHVLLAKRDWLWYFFVFLFMAYGTSHGIMHYDSDLYHAQAIHWIESAGIVKGLGNLHLRLAYNSASFALSAFYSFAFLGKQSLHTMAGFFALLLAWQCLDIKTIIRRRQIVLSDFPRIAAMYYIFTIFDEMVAPASDYFLSTLVFYIIICCTDMYVRHEKAFVPYILLALVGIYAVTVKLSAAPMVLLSIIPIYKLFHSRNDEKIKTFGISVLMAFIITAPFFARNIVISGWILYPVTLLDFFDLAWEIPKGVAQYDSMEIRTFGRGYNDVEAFMNVPFTEWVPNWFGQLSLFHKAMIILSIISLVIYICCIVYFILAAVEHKKKPGKLIGNKVFDLSHRSMLSFADFLTLSGTLILCLVFWFFSAPLIRYGIVYVLATISIVFGRMIIMILHKFAENGSGIKEISFKVLIAFLAIWLVYKGINIVIEDVPRFNSKYLLVQQDYGTYDVDSFKLGDTTIYYPKEGDRAGYAPFPAATHDLTGEVEFLGETITDGLKSVGQ